MIVIEDFMIRDLKLKGLELLTYAVVFECTKGGCGLWCGSASDLAEKIGATNATPVINSLAERGLVIRKELAVDGKKWKILQTKFEDKAPAEATPETKPTEETTGLQEIAERIYKLYPTKCPTSGRGTGKSKSDVQKIVRLLKKGHTEEELAATIKRYIDEATEKRSWIQNFSTFLNNLPDYSEQESGEPQLFTEPRRKPQR